MVPKGQGTGKTGDVVIHGDCNVFIKLEIVRQFSIIYKQPITI